MTQAKKSKPIIRIQFGTTKPVPSMAFVDTTVERLFEVMIKTFAEMKVSKTVTLEDHCPLNKPLTDPPLVITIRAEDARKTRQKGGSKSKSLHGITADQAQRYFLENYKKYTR